MLICARTLLALFFWGATVVHGLALADTYTPKEASAIRELNKALDQWIAATNARDFDAQAQFYPSRVDAFYLQREVPKAAVMKEKRKVFNRARHIDVEAEDPQIILDSNAQSARMYFRKVYAIHTGTAEREGEVLQELRWIKNQSRWQIVSERDIYVIR